MSSKETQYWDGVAQAWSSDHPQRLWRNFCDRLNGQLIRQSLDTHKNGRALKTDLFDEAASEIGLVPQLAESVQQVVGIDLSQVTCRIVLGRHPALGTCAGASRALPFSDRSFDFVLSNSTLDHMETVDDIGTALGEIHRVLRPGGRLLLTLDNLSNPVIALRSIFPQRWLTRLGLVPYYVGATCGPKRLRGLLEQAGLEPKAMGAMMHCPRLPAVATANLLDRAGPAGLKKFFSDSLFWWEALERLPTRYLTGYFIRVVAHRA